MDGGPVPISLVSSLEKRRYGRFQLTPDRDPANYPSTVFHPYQILVLPNRSARRLPFLGTQPIGVHQPPSLLGDDAAIEASTNEIQQRIDRLMASIQLFLWIDIKMKHALEHRLCSACVWGVMPLWINTYADDAHDCGPWTHAPRQRLTSNIIPPDTAG